jgi:hypothetical protein
MCIFFNQKTAFVATKSFSLTFALFHFTNHYFILQIIISNSTVIIGFIVVSVIKYKDNLLSNTYLILQNEH